MKLSSIHKEDLLCLAKVFNQEQITIELAERYGYKIGYEYIDSCIWLNSTNKPLQDTIISNKYKLLTKIKTHLKQLKCNKLKKYS